MCCTYSLRRTAESRRQPPPPPVWNVPYPRNPLFIGREELLALLATALQPGQAAALSQPFALSGLGGIGKTHLAVEYAYRHRQDYQAVFGCVPIHGRTLSPTSWRSPGNSSFRKRTRGRCSRPCLLCKPGCARTATGCSSWTMPMPLSSPESFSLRHMAGGCS